MTDYKNIISFGKYYFEFGQISIESNGFEDLFPPVIIFFFIEFSPLFYHFRDWNKDITDVSTVILIIVVLRSIVATTVYSFTLIFHFKSQK